MAGSRSATAARVILTGSAMVAHLPLLFESADELHFVGIEKLEGFQPDFAAALHTYPIKRQIFITPKVLAPRKSPSSLIVKAEVPGNSSLILPFPYLFKRRYALP